ncbi:G-protein coupled receptor 4-like isoform X1 [Mya arenaria]|uniref:G-protein coupled receptor 4-like isoform X1 n=2 Tax=Mya arenaria TaxID=6604 RepID=UPI0022E3B957|nr:G-protein coupled receptor 4-like isoform X1 [Mya arenaria]XP_052794739.1 G-protein coupled receptor 4-like isoform X1 [Mya arenaria]
MFTNNTSGKTGYKMNGSNLSTPSDGEAIPSSQFANLTAFDILYKTAPQVVMIDRVVTPFWYIIGFLGNPISARIWLSRKVCKSNSSAVYFGSLAIVETVYLVLHVIYELQNAWGINTFHTPVRCEIFNFLLITPQYMVPMLVLGFTTERYIAVCHPFVMEKYCTVKRAVIVICCMGCASVALGLIQVYVWSYSDMFGCVFREGAEIFQQAWTWFTEMLLFLILPVACLLLNLLVIREIKRLSIESAAHGQGTNPASTITLLCVSFYFIFTLLPATIVYAMQQSITQGDSSLPLEQWASDPVWSSYFTYLTVRKIVEEICLSNYAAYFIIYYATGVYFRRSFRQLLCIPIRPKSRAVPADFSMSLTKGKHKCAETVVLNDNESPSDT